MQITCEGDLTRAYSCIPVYRNTGHPLSLHLDPGYQALVDNARAGTVPDFTALDRQFGGKFSTDEILRTLKEIAANN